jgi:hypothetical protein
MFWRDKCDQDRGRNNCKIKSLIVELQPKWNVKITVTPVAIGQICLRIIQSVPEEMLGKHDVKELEKTAILDTANILWGSNITLQKV